MDVLPPDSEKLQIVDKAVGTPPESIPTRPRTRGRIQHPMTHENGSTTTRSQFLGGAAKLGAAGALGAGALPALLGASSAAAAVKSKKIAVIEQQFGTFFTVNFNKPAQAFIKKSPGWSVTFGNENNTVTTGINLLNSYVSQGYGVLILSTGDNMSAWENSVKKAVDAGAVFINHCTQAVSGA